MADAGEGRLSAAAQARLQADLPGLLAALRGRRRRRQTVRAAVATLLLVSGAAMVFRSGGAPTVVPVLPDGTAPRCTIVRDDPQVLARLAVPTTVRAEWFVDDAGLQALLRAADRPDGLVRVDRQVLVSAEAVDPFPELQP